MNIIIYSPRFVLGGMENAVYHLVRLLLKRKPNYIITIVYDVEDLSTYEIHKKYGSLCGLQSSVGKRFHCDILINTFPAIPVLSYITAIRTIYWSHSCHLSMIKKIPKDNITITQSQWHKEALERRRIPSIVITNVLDSLLIRKLANEPINDFLFNENQLYFLVVARISPEKGWDRIIEFMINQKHLNPKLIVIGGIYFDENIAIKEKVENALKENVIFLGEKANPYKYIKASDYVLCLSDHETYGLVSEEAHILNKQVVFSEYETAVDQFVKDFDMWYNHFNINLEKIDYQYNETKNISSIDQWVALLE